MNDDLVDFLAVYRITRLIVDDRVPFGWVRERIRAAAFDRQEIDGPGSKDPYLVELLECPWCASIWVGLGVLILRRFPFWRPLARVLAASAVAGLASAYVER